PAVDSGGCAGRPEAAGEAPGAVGLEPLVEGIDRGHLLRGGGAGLIINHRNQVLHLGSSPLASGRPSWAAVPRSPLLRKPLPRSDTPPKFLPRTSWRWVRRSASARKAPPK